MSSAPELLVIVCVALVAGVLLASPVFAALLLL